MTATLSLAPPPVPHPVPHPDPSSRSTSARPEWRRRVTGPVARRGAPLQPPSHSPQCWSRRAAETQGGARAPGWRGRTRLASRALPRGGGGGHARSRGFRRGGRHEPSAADPPRDPRRRPVQTRIRDRPDRGHQPARARRAVRNAPDVVQRAGHHSRLRPGRRRDGQFPDPLPRQRRVRAGRPAECVRQHFPV